MSRGHMACLKGLNWLNDEIMNIYMGMLLVRTLQMSSSPAEEFIATMATVCTCQLDTATIRLFLEVLKRNAVFALHTNLVSSVAMMMWRRESFICPAQGLAMYDARTVPINFDIKCTVFIPSGFLPSFPENVMHYSGSGCRAA